jgi:hypothetical protein
MSLHWPGKMGVNYVPEYQASGHTLVVTGSSNKIFLTHVASSITVSAIDADKAITFYDGNHSGHDFTVPVDTTARFKGKFLTLKIPSDASALIEITNIPSSSYAVPAWHELHRISNDGF